MCYNNQRWRKEEISIKRFVAILISAVILISFANSVAFAGYNGNPYKYDELAFTIEYENVIPAPESIIVNWSTPHVLVRNIRVNPDRKLMSIDFCVDDGRYTLAITSRKQIHFIPYKAAANLKTYTAYRIEGASAFRVFLTWDEAFNPDDDTSSWVADEYGLKSINPVSNEPIYVSTNARYSGERLYFDENG